MAYFSNGTEGTILENQCIECKISNTQPCPVIGIQMIHNYNQVTNKNLKSAMNMLVDEKGKCLMKVQIDQCENLLYDQPASKFDAFEQWAKHLVLDLEKGECDILGDPYYTDLHTRDVFIAYCAKPKGGE